MDGCQNHTQATNDNSKPFTGVVELDGDAIIANARALGPEIEAAAETIARDRSLPRDLVESMRRAGIFRIAFPRAWAGPEMEPLQQCELMETPGTTIHRSHGWQ